MDENSKVNIAKITVAGNDRTALSFFDCELQEIKAKGQTLGEIAKLMSAKTERLLSLDMFEAVDTNLVLTTDIHGTPVGELKLNVKEKGVTFFKAETFVKSETTSEVGFELQAALRNPMGYGETFRVNSTTTQTGAREYLSVLSVPNVGPKKLNLNLSLKSSTENMSYYTAYHLKTDAFNMELSTQDRKHHLVGEYALRDEIPMGSSAKLNTPDTGKPTWSLFDFTAPLASAVTTNTAMASVKTSLKYLCTLLDSRDNASNPSKGSYLQGSVEVAAPPGILLIISLVYSGYLALSRRHCPYCHFFTHCKLSSLYLSRHGSVPTHRTDWPTPRGSRPSFDGPTWTHGIYVRFPGHDSSHSEQRCVGQQRQQSAPRCDTPLRQVCGLYI